MTAELSKPADTVAARPAAPGPGPAAPEWGAATDRGFHRENNEDAWGAFALGAQCSPLPAVPAAWPPDGALFVLSDGMGGAQAGEEASRFCVAGLAPELHARRAAENPEDAMRDAILAVHDALIALGRSKPEWKGLGATLTALWLLPNGQAVLGHVGDSRAYHRRDGQWSQWTLDHTLGDGLVRRGQMSAAAAGNFRFRSLLEQVMGGDGRSIEPQVETAPCGPDFAFVLCSDGLYRPLERGLDVRFAAALRQPELGAAAGNLVGAANLAGGPDNITVVLVRAVAPGEP